MKINIFKNVYFYIAFIAFFLIFNYYFHWSAFSFWSIWLWSVRENIKIGEKFVRQESSDDTAIWVALANIKLWEWDFNYYYYIWEAIKLAETSQLLVANDTVELLESSADKQTILETHLNEIELALNKSQDALSTLNDYINEKKAEQVLCETNKKQADTTFFQWLSSNEKDLIIQWLTESVSNWTCSTDRRIYANAYVAVYNKLDYYSKILVEKRNLIETNQDLILQNYWNFRNTFLEKLIDLRDRLNSYNNINEES